MSEQRSLQVLDEANHVLVGSIAGSHNPVVVLDGEAVTDLVLLLRKAKARLGELQPTRDVTPISVLCDAIDAILTHYAAVRSKFYPGLSERLEIENVERELEELAKQLEQFHRP